MAQRPDLFNHTINQLRYGQVAEELSEQLSACVEAARDTGKQAVLTVVLKLKPEANGAQVFITEDIKTKIPTFPREATIMFPTIDGNLQRDDPRQKSLPGLKEVESEKITEFKQATA